MEDFWMEERRRFIRMPTFLEVVVKKEGIATEEKGLILDISPGGAKLVYRESLPLGMIVILKFSLEEGIPPVEIEGRVVWGKKDMKSDIKSEYHHGIQFLKHEEFSKLGDKFLDYLAFKKRMESFKEKNEK